MAYDRERLEEIQRMTPGELVTLMIARFNRDASNPEWSTSHDMDYFWASERLDALFKELKP